jgi:tungstate transport system substrate-binding protein
MLAGVSAPGRAADRSITVASTASTQNSGLFDALLPPYTARTGVQVRVIAVGTGQALRLGENGDADVVLVHDTAAELEFEKAGHTPKRYPLMFNDFVLIGPQVDPAGVRGVTDAVAALIRIATTQATFVSRGDDSGTHRAELRLWRDAGLDPRAASGAWYKEVGGGMGATLNVAAGLGAYALTDRATWTSFRNRAALDLLLAGDPRLFNQYGVMLVNPALHPHVKKEDAQAFIDWLVGAQGQAAIAGFRVDGEQVYFPNAR